MRDFVRKPWHWVSVIVVLTFMAALMASVFNASRTNLPSYTPTEQTMSTEPLAPTLDIDTIEFHADTIDLSMLVPASWTHITKSGHDAFVNQADGAMISIAINPYDPTLNAVTEEVATRNVLNHDGAVGAFVKEDNCSYSIVYEVGKTAYIEHNVWDLSNTVCISMQVPAARYSHYQDTLLSLLDTLHWNQRSPIPSGYTVYYSDYGSFEFGIPEGWAATLEGNEMLVRSQNGSCYKVTLTSTSERLDSITQLNYSEVMSQGKDAYILSMFSNTGDTLTTEASYSNAETPYIEAHSILANGAFQYAFLYQGPETAQETDLKAYQIALSLFRVF